ncbi:unnamed protein product [Auanema sp. JU1783]|nr:unnamed protein product [Auanema sp. JU1783]
MGASVSTLFGWIYWYISPAPRKITPIVDNTPDNTLLLLSAAAQLASLTSRMDDGAGTSVSTFDEETENFMKLSSSSSDDEDELSCALQESYRQHLFEKNRRSIGPARLLVGKKNSYDNLVTQTSAACGTRSSAFSANCRRELGLNHTSVDAYSDAKKVSLNNNYFPNQRKVLDNLRAKIFCVQHLEETDELAIACQEERLYFYKPVGKNERYVKSRTIELTSVGWSVLDVAFNQQGSGFAYCTWKDSIMYCRYLDEHKIQYECINLSIPLVHSSSLAVFSIRFSNPGHEILAGTSDYSIYIFDIETQSRVVSVNQAHDDDVNAVCYADEAGNLIFSGGDDGIVKAWDRRCLREGDNTPVGYFAGHKDGITYIDSRGDSRYLLSNSKDQTIKLWDVRHFSSNEAAEETKRSVSKQNWDYRWQAAPKMIEKPLNGDSSIATLRGHRVLHTLIRAKFSPASTGQRYIYTGCAGGEVVVYDIISGSLKARLSGHQAVVRDVSWSANRNEIVSSSWDGQATCWRYGESNKTTTAESTKRVNPPQLSGRVKKCTRQGTSSTRNRRC